MRVLVTGAGGFVGSHLVRALAADGCEVFAGNPDGLPSGVPDGVRWVELDVTSAESVRAAVAESRPAQVYHLAGQASVAESFTDPLATWNVNATGTLRLVAALPGGTRVLLAGSAEAYGAVPEAEQPIAEDHPLRPATPYGASKAAAEMVVVQASLAGDVHGVAARSFNHTGAGHDPRFALPSFARQLARIAAGEAEPVLRVGNLSPLRDFLDVGDVVRGYRTLMERGARGGVYNVCSGTASSLRGIVDELVAISGLPVRVEVDPDRVRPVDVPLLLGDGGRLRALGWAPRTPLRETLAALLRHEMAAAGVAEAV